MRTQCVSACTGKSSQAVGFRWAAGTTAGVERRDNRSSVGSISYRCGRSSQSNAQVVETPTQPSTRLNGWVANAICTHDQVKLEPLEDVQHTLSKTLAGT